MAQKRVWHTSLFSSGRRFSYQLGYTGIAGLTGFSGPPAAEWHSKGVRDTSICMCSLWVARWMLCLHSLALLFSASQEFWARSLFWFQPRLQASTRILDF